MKIDAALVSHVAKLASLSLSAEESDELSGQLTRIVEHFEALRSIPDDLLPAMPDAPPTPFRMDEAFPANLGSLVESNAPEFAHGHFVVPRVVSRDE